MNTWCQRICGVGASPWRRAWIAGAGLGLDLLFAISCTHLPLLIHIERRQDFLRDIPSIVFLNSLLTSSAHAMHHASMIDLTVDSLSARFHRRFSEYLKDRQSPEIALSWTLNGGSTVSMGTFTQEDARKVCEDELEPALFSANEE
jgi:hypothetical protein